MVVLVLLVLPIDYPCTPGATIGGFPLRDHLNFHASGSIGAIRLVTEPAQTPTCTSYSLGVRDLNK